MAGSLPSSSSNFHLNWAIGAWHGRRLARLCRRQGDTGAPWANLFTGHTGDPQVTSSEWNTSTKLAVFSQQGCKREQRKSLVSSNQSSAYTLLHSRTSVGWPRDSEQHRTTWCSWFLSWFSSCLFSSPISEIQNIGITQPAKKLVEKILKRRLFHMSKKLLVF